MNSSNENSQNSLILNFPIKNSDYVHEQIRLSSFVDGFSTTKAYFHDEHLISTKYYNING